MLNDSELENLVRIACEAGTRILPFFQQSCARTLKADNSPVSEADLASHNFLEEALSGLSTIPVVSEESCTAHEALDLSGDYWLVDPLDGTKEFLNGRPEFTVNIALMRRHVPVLAAVYAPALALTYAGRIGGGSWKREHHHGWQSIATRPAVLSQLTVVASKNHCGPRVQRLLERLSSPIVTNIGSSLKFCLVAEGKADLYYRDVPTMEWDTAAAQCVLEAAGGFVLGLNGKTLSYGKADLRNGPFVAVGDSGFPWKKLAGSSDTETAFEQLFNA